MKKIILVGAVAAVFAASTAMAETPASATRTEATVAGANQAYSNQWRVYKLIGLEVYNQNNEKLGDISDLLVDQTGTIQTAILGVGGFLGVGERMVAVSYEQLKFSNQAVEMKVASTASPKTADVGRQTTTGAATTAAPVRSSGERWYPDHAVINLTADQLKAMPKFEYN